MATIHVSDSSSNEPERERSHRSSSITNTGELLTESITGKDSRKFDNILAITDSKQLNEDYTSVYSTCALVGALVMSFLSGTNEADADELGKINMYGAKYTALAIEINQVIVLLCFCISLIILFLSAVMLTQLAHVPETNTKTLFRELGDAKVHAPLAHMQKLLSLYALHFLLTTTIYYNMITSIICIALSVLTILFCVITASQMVNKKKKVIADIRSKMT